MSNVNTCIFMGRLTKKPELITVGDCELTNLSLAINKKYKDKEETCFIDIVAFNKVANVLVTHCDKGQQLYIEAEAQNKSREIDGKNYQFTNFKLKEFKFIGSKSA